MNVSSKCRNASEKELKEKKISGGAVFEGGLLNVHKDRVELPNGKESSREYIKHPGAVLVIPFIDDRNVVMERQFRYPAGEIFLEFPAGKIDPGEDPEETGARELLEETGYRAGRLRYLTKLYPGIGYSDEIIYIYRADDLRLEKSDRDTDEFLEIFTVGLDEAYRCMIEGGISDAKTMVALFWVKQQVK